MSFILDALRKSDARRQQSGAPGLNSPEPPRPNRRRRRLLPGLAAALVLLAVVVVGVYFVRPGWLPLGSGDTQQARVTDGEPASPRAEPASDRAGETGSTDDVAVDEEQLARIEEIAEEPEADAANDSSAGADSEKSQAADDQTRDRRRRRVPPSEQEQVAQQRDVVQEQSRQRETEPVSAEDAREELRRRMAEAESRRSRERTEPSRDEPEEARQPGPEAAPEPETSESGTEAKELNEGVSEYVRAWELPLSVRRELPDLSLTIHVYSPDEAERFVLINGERHVAGDEIEGARIVDIRREGAVVDFRSHRFLLEPR
ncbi:general secretion pathway protein GspB [Wenzhouxiangella sp. EGI_FJ10305]|uniref:general secretion pathway protein GspB n=1 Tax=Wenzhouxiangella sp. EGI_FJ10305 TaxID=3243768 RepID=UPI0035DCBE93